MAILTDGDWVLVDRSRREVRTDGVFLLLMHGERRIKRVQQVAADQQQSTLWQGNDQAAGYEGCGGIRVVLDKDWSGFVNNGI